MSTEILDTIAQSQDQQRELAEAFITDVMSQLEVIDPVEDAEEIHSLLEAAVNEGQAGKNILHFLLGMDAEEWLEELVVD